MFRKSLLSLSVLLVAVSVSNAQLTSLTENFDLITTLPGSGWFQQNNSVPGLINWFQGNSAVFPAQAGATGTEYIAANFNNTAGTNTISNWLLTPQLDFTNGGTMTFFTRTVPAPAFPDRLQVRNSTTGASTNVGATATDIGDFTTLLLDVNPTYTLAGYPNAWTQFTVNIPSIANGRIAFRYFVENGGPSGANSDYIGIDTFAWTSNSSSVPEPTTLALMGIGGMGLAVVCRRAKKFKARWSKSEVA